MGVKLLYLLRLRPWRHKIAGLRVAAYPLLGYALSAELQLPAQAAHLAAVVGVLTACYALNDYYDWKILGEDNYQGNQVDSGRLSERRALGWSWSPLLLAAGLIWTYSPLILVLYAVMTFSVVAYSVPPLRLKHRPILGIVVPPLAVTLAVLQGYLIGADLNLKILFLCALIFMFQLYLEMMHILEDATIEEEFTKLGEDKAWSLFRKLPAVSLVSSLVFSLLYPVFLVTAIASTVRLLALRNTLKSDILELRRKIWRPQWSLFEFVLYALSGIMGWFSV